MHVLHAIQFDTVKLWTAHEEHSYMQYYCHYFNRTIEIISKLVFSASATLARVSTICDLCPLFLTLVFDNNSVWVPVASLSFVLIQMLPVALNCIVLPIILLLGFVHTYTSAKLKIISTTTLLEYWFIHCTLLMNIAWSQALNIYWAKEKWN